MAVSSLIQSNQKEIGAICRKYAVKRLEVFGSVLRDDFDPLQSDVDFLVEFGTAASGDSFSQYFGFKEELEAVLGCPVDLVQAGAVRNPYLRAVIDENRMELYAA